MNKAISQSFGSAPNSLMRTVFMLALAGVVVLLVEAAFVLITGWPFHQSILGGRIKPGTIVWFVLLLVISRALLRKYSDRPRARCVAFAICIIVFAGIACGLSIEFAWSHP